MDKVINRRTIWESKDFQYKNFSDYSISCYLIAFF